VPTTRSRRWLTSGMPIIPQKSPAFRQSDFYSVSRKRMHKPVLYAHATVSLFQAFVEGTGLSRFLGGCCDEFGCEVSRGFLLAVYGRFGQEYEQFRSFCANSARYAICAKPHKHWLFRISLIWRVGT